MPRAARRLNQHPARTPAEEQLSLFTAHDRPEEEREALERLFSRAAGAPVSLVLTDNSTVVLSVKNRGEEVRVRLHRMFLGAEGGILDEISRFIKRRKGEMPLLRQFVKRNRALLGQGPRRAVNAVTQGAQHDLRPLYDKINKEYFGGSVSALITWGSGRTGRRAGKRTLGSYSSHTNTIRISPLLDRKGVPRYFLEFIIYHEMLHAALGIEEREGRRRMHSREFRRRERLFKGYERALAWEKEGL